MAVLSTLLCSYYSLQADFPLTIIGIAIVFPVVFSIDSAYKRRERTLMLLSDFKAHVNAIFMASQQWIAPANKEIEHEVKNDLISVFEALKHLCSVHQKDYQKAETNIYQKINNLSQTLQKLRKLDMYLGEVSRVNQYVSKLIIDIENIKVIKQYRTPVTLRAYSRVFIYSFPILYGPYFVHAAQEYSHGLEYFMPIIFSFILVSLDNIQEHLENPFDQIGEDDVKFDIEDFAAQLK